MNNITITTNDKLVLLEINKDELLKNFISNKKKPISFGLENLIPIVLSIPASIASSIVANKIIEIYKKKCGEVNIYINNIEVNVTNVEYIIKKLDENN